MSAQPSRPVAEIEGERELSADTTITLSINLLGRNHSRGLDQMLNSY